MPMYNMLEYSKYYSKITDSFWNYYRDEPNNPPFNNYNTDHQQILSLLNTEAVSQGKYQMKIKRTMKTLKKEIQRLKEVLKLLFH